jgi:hypothetical protein
VLPVLQSIPAIAITVNTKGSGEARKTGENYAKQKNNTHFKLRPQYPI